MIRLFTCRDPSSELNNLLKVCCIFFLGLVFRNDLVRRYIAKRGGRRGLGQTSKLHDPPY